jgi:hypothetical protein
MSDFIPNRVNSGKAGAGQFDFKRNSEADLELTDEAPATERVFETAHEALSTDAVPTQLFYIDQGDSLTDEQKESILKGDWDSVDNEVFNNFYEGREYLAREQAEEEINGLVAQGRFHTEWEDLDEDAKREAVEAVMSRDESDPMGDLLKTGGSHVYLASKLGHTYDEVDRDSPILEPDHEGKYTNERAALISSVLAKNGLDSSSPETQAAIRKLVESTPGHWHDADIDVVWNGNVADASPKDRREEGGEEGWDAKGRELSFEGPEIVINRGSYSGSQAVSIPGTLKKTVTVDNPAEIDSGSHGDNTYGAIVRTTGWINE